MNDAPNVGRNVTEAITKDRAEELRVLAGNVFKPRTPIAVRAFFAGRWAQITTLADAVGQTGLHVVIYGERGVGKTSMANVVKPLIEVFDEVKEDPPERLIVKTIADSEDTFSDDLGQVV